MNFEKDIVIKRSDEWFRLRACAIIMHEQKILMATSNTANFYYAIGGGVQHG